MLSKLGLLDLLYKKVKNLSGGEKQRVCIARALINNPDIILADDPTGNLDSENSRIVMELLKKIADSGKTVILVTHNRSDAIEYGDRIIELKDGCLVNEAE